MLQRQYIFANRRAYNIAGTMAYIANLHQEDDLISEDTYENVMAQLSAFKFIYADSQDYIQDLYNGMLMPTGLWLHAYGIEEVSQFPIPEEDASVGTFDITLSDIDSDEECIDSDDEEDMCIGTVVIAELVLEDAIERGLQPEGINHDDFVLDMEGFDDDSISEPDAKRTRTE